MAHRLYIVEREGARIGSIKAVSAASAVDGFKRAVPAENRRGLSARKAAPSELPRKRRR